MNGSELKPPWGFYRAVGFGLLEQIVGSWEKNGTPRMSGVNCDTVIPSVQVDVFFFFFFHSFHILLSKLFFNVLSILRLLHTIAILGGIKPLRYSNQKTRFKPFSKRRPTRRGGRGLWAPSRSRPPSPCAAAPRKRSSGGADGSWENGWVDLGCIRWSKHLIKDTIGNTERSSVPNDNGVLASQKQ